jgi:hypothetical protein
MAAEEVSQDRCSLRAAMKSILLTGFIIITAVVMVICINSCAMNQDQCSVPGFAITALVAAMGISIAIATCEHLYPADNPPEDSAAFAVANGEFAIDIPGGLTNEPTISPSGNNSATRII